MSFNSYKEDEQLKENGKLKTLLRLLSYLLTYKKQIIAVLLIMLVSTVLTLITPLFYEYAIANAYECRKYRAGVVRRQRDYPVRI